MNRSLQTRATLVCVALATCLSIISWRLFDIQIHRHAHYSRLAARNHLETVPIFAKRGAIRDCNGDLLAGNVPVKTVAVDGTILDPGGPLIPILCRHLEIPEDKIRAKIKPHDKYISLKSRVEEQVVDAILADIALAERDLAKKLGQEKATPIRGIVLDQDFRRVYPNGRLLSHVVGYYGWYKDEKTQRGLHGVERSMDVVLTGKNGLRYIERDSVGRELVPYRVQGEPALDGSDVILTIDRGIQTIVEEELDIAVTKYKPKAAVIIFLRPHTGEILAMGCRPNFDPGNPAASPTQAQINHAVSSVFEPGSTFKIVAVGAALNDGIVDLETEIFCENGKYSYAGHVLGDHRSYGDLTVREIVTQSSNIGSAKLGIQIGQKRFYNYIRRFGFAFKTGIELPGELAGILAPPEAWSGVSIAQLPMGQGIGVTPLQMVTAMNVIASGGKLVAPRLVYSLVDPATQKPHRFRPVVRWQVISPRAAADLSIALEENTREDGTGSLAAVPGFRTAGKTGTAQKIDPQTKAYAKGRYVVSFAGFLPAEEPKICGIVLFDEADVDSREYYGGQIAAPVFSRVAARIATYLDLRSKVSPTAINRISRKGDQI